MRKPYNHQCPDAILRASLAEGGPVKRKKYDDGGSAQPAAFGQVTNTPTTRVGPQNDWQQTTSDAIGQGQNMMYLYGALRKRGQQNDMSALTSGANQKGGLIPGSGYDSATRGANGQVEQVAGQKTGEIGKNFADPVPDGANVIRDRERLNAQRLYGENFQRKPGPLPQLQPAANRGRSMSNASSLSGHSNYSRNPQSGSDSYLGQPSLTLQAEHSREAMMGSNENAARQISDIYRNNLHNLNKKGGPVRSKPKRGR